MFQEMLAALGHESGQGPIFEALFRAALDGEKAGVRTPAFSPAGRTLGRISRSFQGKPFSAAMPSYLAAMPWS